MKENPRARLLAYVTGLINQELLLKKNAWQRRIASCEHTCQPAYVPKPDTIRAWYRKLVARSSIDPNNRCYPGRPPIEPKLEALIVQMARRIPVGVYDRIVGALANLGYTVSD
jgi:hypothetical protein